MKHGIDILHEVLLSEYLEYVILDLKISLLVKISTSVFQYKCIKITPQMILITIDDVLATV